MVISPRYILARTPLQIGTHTIQATHNASTYQPTFINPTYVSHIYKSAPHISISLPHTLRQRLGHGNGEPLPWGRSEHIEGREIKEEREEERKREREREERGERGEEAKESGDSSLLRASEARS